MQHHANSTMGKIAFPANLALVRNNAVVEEKNDAAD
jgi:hypothetical protein